jgi:formamidopyrimidine-DNA glycosylase
VPELPDVEVYVERLNERFAGRTLAGVRLMSPFLVRSVEPPLTALVGKQLEEVRRLGKRLVFRFAGELYLVLHLMIAGRLRERPPGAEPPGKIGLCAFDFDGATLLLTEASSKKRASIHLVAGAAGLAAHDRGGLEPLGASPAAFAEAVARERHTLKRTLTDPRLFSGIGNAYSDEILHRARLSPVQMSDRLDAEAVERLRRATVEVLSEWTAHLRQETQGRFPEEVTAFRPEMAVHGRYRQPCPVCQTPVQRIRHAENETNYCPTCQTGGRLLADRALSRLLHGDWPRSLEELEERKAQQRAGPPPAPAAPPPRNRARTRKKPG